MNGVFKLPLGKIFLASGLVWQALKAGFFSSFMSSNPCLNVLAFVVFSKDYNRNQTCPNSFKFVQIGSNMSKLVQNCLNRFKLVQIELKMPKLVQTFPNWIQLVQKGSQISSNFFKKLQTCLEWVKR